MSHVPVTSPDASSVLRGRAQHDLGLVGLRQAGEEPQHAGEPAQAHEQDPGGVGVERPGVADPALREDAAAPGHGVVRGPAGLFVHHHHADGLGRRRRSLPGVAGIVSSPGVGVVVGGLAQVAEDLLDPQAVGHGRVRLEVEQGGALHPHLAADGPLQLGPLLGEGLDGGGGQRAQVDRGPATGRG